MTAMLLADYCGTSVFFELFIYNLETNLFFQKHFKYKNLMKGGEKRDE